MYKWFKDFLGYKESGGTTEAVPQGALGKERVSGELAMEIGQYHGNIIKNKTTSCNEIGINLSLILQLDVSLLSFQTMLPASAMEQVTEHCQSPTPSPSVQAAVPCVGR